MFSHCTGHSNLSQTNLSGQNHSSSHYYNGGSSNQYHARNVHHHNNGGTSSFFNFCMQGMCGHDPSGPLSAGRKYSTTMEDNSSITALTHNQLNFDDDCRISLNRFKKKGQNGREMLFIQAKAILTDDEVDEAHDLLYLVKMPEVFNDAGSIQNHSPEHSNKKMVDINRKAVHQKPGGSAKNLLNGSEQSFQRSNSGGIQMAEKRSIKQALSPT